MPVVQSTAHAVNSLSALPAPPRSQTASTETDATGALAPWSSADDNHVPAQLALSYAEPPASRSPTPAAPMGTALTRTLSSQSGLTIAAKRGPDQSVSTVVSTGIRSIATRVGARLDNPWVRAIVLSPSVRRFLTTLALGARDFRSLASLMRKPASSVMMTFAADPNPGLDQDHFSGSAIVFVSTVSYPTHTASLR